jgi:hypothetical protein
MIRFILHDFKGAVNLLHENHPKELMREGHLRKRNQFVAAGFDFRG